VLVIAHPAINNTAASNAEKTPRAAGFSLKLLKTAGVLADR
jgi:hypothetical protein